MRAQSAGVRGKGDAARQGAKWRRGGSRGRRGNEPGEERAEKDRRRQGAKDDLLIDSRADTSRSSLLLVVNLRR